MNRQKMLIAAIIAALVCALIALGVMMEKPAAVKCRQGDIQFCK